MNKQAFSLERLIIFCMPIVVFVFASCGGKKIDIVVKNSIDSSKIGKIKTVLILGNSIVRQPSQPEIGWNGDWGMAATVRDSDFVHLLIRNIKLKDSSVVVRFKNIVPFEYDFTGYPLSNLDSFKRPDLLIVRISENVQIRKAMKDDFIAHYNKLINYIDPDKKSVRVIVDGFWKKGYKYKWHNLWTVEGGDINNMIKQYAIKNNYPFISTTSLSQDSTNMAGKRFEDAGIASHPSDKGMRLIADKIWNYIKNYF